MPSTNLFKKILVLLTLSALTFGVIGITPTQAAPANSPAGLGPADWAQIKSMLPPSQEAYLKASNTGGNDNFGWSVAISGDTVVVGAPYESSNATGVNGDETNELALESGAVYVFTRSGTTWSQQAYLKASNTAANSNFGYSVAISGDTVVVGAPLEDSNATGVNGAQTNNLASASGAVYVFTRSGTNWSQQAYLKASNTDAGDRFGWLVTIDGDTVVVGAPHENSNATAVNGNQADNSAGDSGAAYVFTRSGTNWSQQAYLKASNTGAGDEFGIAVAISGDTVVVGASIEDSNATGVNGDETNNLEAQSGAAYVFTRSAITWSQQAYLKASNTDGFDQFGNAVAISGDTVVVGALEESSNATGVNGDETNHSSGASGAAYVFTRSGTIWNQQAYLKASNTDASDNFGWSVTIAGDTALVAARFESSNATGVNGNQGDDSAGHSGAVYVFTRSGTTWSQQAYVKASNTGAIDGFGWSVAISGDTALMGAYREDSNATGVNGNQADNSANSAGAAYVFAAVAPNTPTPTSTVTVTETVTPTSTSTVTATETVAPTSTSTFTQTHTPTVTETDTQTSTVTATKTNTVTPTPSPTWTMTRTPTRTVTRTPTKTATVSSAPVKVTLNQAAGQTDPTSTRLLRFTVAFSEAVTGFTASDVKLTLSETCAPSVAITGSGKIYSISLTNMTIECTATVSIPAGKVNSVSRPAITNAASTSTDNSQQFLYDVKIYYSPAASDGWLLESTSTSGVGGSMNSTATTMSIGDDVSNREYRIMSRFNSTADSVPASAVIAAINYRITPSGITGVNPLNTHGALMTELNAPNFGNSSALELIDFQSAPDQKVCNFEKTLLVDNAYRCVFFNAAISLFPKSGVIDLRSRFANSDTNNTADLLNIYSGNYAFKYGRPQLFVSYYFLP